ncbi:MAG: hypothetical protein AAF573_09355 [Bacteroidota bacterium]
MKKLLKLISFSLLILLTSIPLFSQNHELFSEIPEGRYYSIQVGKWLTNSRLLMLAPEIHGFKSQTLGLSIAKMKSNDGEGGGNAKVIQLGAEYNLLEKIIAPKISYWKGGWVFGFGGKIGINGLYYFDKNTSSPAVRPMIGIGIMYFHFNYGYTVFMNKNFDEINPHSFYLSWQHTLLPWRRNR